MGHQGARLRYFLLSLWPRSPFGDLKCQTEIIVLLSKLVWMDIKCKCCQDLIVFMLDKLKDRKMDWANWLVTYHQFSSRIFHLSINSCDKSILSSDKTELSGFKVQEHVTTWQTINSTHLFHQMFMVVESVSEPSQQTPLRTALGVLQWVWGAQVTQSPLCGNSLDSKKNPVFQISIWTVAHLLSIPNKLISN